MRERTIEKRFTDEVQKHGGKALKFVSPGHNGVPDRIVLLPDGRTVYVELKAPGKPLRPLQAKWARTLTGMNHVHYKIDSHEDTDRFITEVFGHGV
ncbi:MAG: VRR-NUC domain-containing protein [Candidatus Pristimantibacillus sp.]